METRYNLRSSNKEEHVVPVQLHSDEDFLTQTLGGSHSSPGQVSLDQSDSTNNSDLDIKCSAENICSLLTKICSPPDFGSNKSAKSTGHAHMSGWFRTGSRDQKSPSQVDINKQILFRLSRLGDRLTNIKRYNSKLAKLC